MSDCVVVGAGLTGSLLAIYLAKQGYTVDVYERRVDMRRADISAGRSINLAISVRGISALSRGDVAERVMQHAIPMRGRMLHPVSGDCFDQAYGRNDTEHQNSLSRALLNTELMSAAEEYPGVQFHFSHRCTDYDPHSETMSFHNELTNAVKEIKAPLVFAADGAFSQVRKALENRELLTCNVEPLMHCYKELCIPPEFGHQLEQNYLHIWPRQKYMLIALPNTDSSFTVTLFMAKEGAVSFAKLHSAELVQNFFAEQFPDVVNLMPGLVADYFNNPTGEMVTVKCTPWHIGGKVLLVGDAAHAIVPFLGQGMNCCFEDCSVLLDMMIKNGDNWEKVFADFHQQRKANTDAIAQMALDNYIEMRDRVADHSFHQYKAIEQELMRRYPEKYLSSYNMIAFHHHDYALAQYAATLQQSLLPELHAGLSSSGEIPWPEFDGLLQDYFKKIDAFQA